MQSKAGGHHIVAYEIGFEGETNWDRPVLFNLASIDRIYKSETGKARFTIAASATEPVEFVTKCSFEEVVEHLGAIH